MNYAESALRNELAALRNAQPGQRNMALNRAAYALGQLVGGGLLGSQAVTAALSDAATGLGLSPAESRVAIESGLRAGQQQPRRGGQVPHNPHNPQSPQLWIHNPHNPHNGWQQPRRHYRRPRRHCRAARRRPTQPVAAYRPRHWQPGAVGQESGQAASRRCAGPCTAPTANCRQSDIASWAAAG